MLLRTALILVALSAPALADTAKLPPAVTMHIDDARALCEPAFGKFTFNPEAVVSLDLNGDKRPDYVLSDDGYQCSGAASLYGGSGGSMQYMILSQPGGDGTLYATDPASVLGYGFTIDETQKPPHVVFQLRCPDGKDGTDTGPMAFHWSDKDKKMTRVFPGEGCDK